MPDQTSIAKKEIRLEAAVDHLGAAQDFVEDFLGEACPVNTRMQIALAVEEIFVNIALYAYAPETGEVRIGVELYRDPAAVAICFADRGIPYDPLAKRDPDVSLPAEERDIGGLGIYMTKQFMDEMNYEYRDGQNILSMKKNL